MAGAGEYDNEMMSLMGGEVRFGVYILHYRIYNMDFRLDPEVSPPACLVQPLPCTGTPR